MDNHLLSVVVYSISHASYLITKKEEEKRGSCTGILLLTESSI